MHAPTNSGPAKNRPSGISRLKPRLRGGAAWMILPAIAMVVPLGVALNPARADVTINGPSGPIAFSTYSPETQFFITGAGSVTTASGTAITGDVQNAYLNNDGTISGTTYGILGGFGGFGTVYNSGSIGGSTYTGVSLFGGSVQNSGTITGAGKFGVWMGGGGGTVVNTNTIHGGGYGILLTGGGAISNTGSITGAVYYGIKLTGGSGATITNGDASHTAALISGVRNGILSDSAGLVTVTNYGTIMNSGSGFNAIVLNAGGVVDNRAGGVINGDTVSGRGGGVRISGGTGTVTNGGTISALTGDGVFLGAGGTISNTGEISGIGSGISLTGNYAITITNSGSGSISGGSYGIFSCNCAGPITITNDGMILGGDTGVKLEDAGFVTNSGTITGTSRHGIYLGAGGTVTNQAGGNIHGYYQGIRARNTAATVVNFGTVSNSNSGSNAIELDAGGVVDNRAGGFIVGVLGDGGGVSISGGAGTVTNAGTISSLQRYGVFLADGGTITNGSSSNTNAYISGVGAYGATRLVNYGTIGPSNSSGFNQQSGAATVVNSGTIAGYSYGVVLAAGGIITNTGTISGLGGGGFYPAGIYIKGGTATITNGDAGHTGALVSGGDFGIFAYDGGCGCTPLSTQTITNFGTIRGGTGIGLDGGGLVTNSGVITGMDLGGVLLKSSGTVDNKAGASISGKELGVAIYGTGTVNNSGIIAAATQISGFPPSAGVQIYYGGMVNNYAGASISGTSLGVGIGGGTGTVNNFGTITTTAQPGGPAPNIYGVQLLDGGVVNNHAGASITGYGMGVSFSGYSGTLNNSGTITGAGTDVSFGVMLGATYGTINNQGLIQGGVGVFAVGYKAVITNGSSSNHSAAIIGNGSGYGPVAGVFGFNGTLINYGTIAGPALGVSFQGGGTVTNHAGGTITGGALGVAVIGQGTVTNHGVIIATGGVTGFPGPALGVVAYGYGGAIPVINTGSISGEIGVYTPAGPIILTNFGTITGTGGTAVYGALTGNRLILGQGYKFNGIVDMGGTLEWAKGTGTLSNLAALNSNFTDLEIDQGAIITNAGSGAAVINVTNKGTIAPTAPVNLTGNFVQTSSGTLQTVLGPDGGATTLNITGAANLDGNVVVVPNGVSATTYTILTATGGVSGSFASVSGGTLLLKPSLSYDAKDAFVTLTQQPVTSVAATPNQLALAGALDKGVAANPAFFAPLMNVINQFTDPAKLTGVLESLTGEGHASLSTLGLVTGFNMVGAFQQHSQGTIGPNEAPDDPWITGFAQSGHFSPIGSQAVHENVMGATAGADHVFFPGFRGGVMAGMGVLHANVGPNAQASINYQQVALTADYVNGAWFADGLIGFSHSRGNTVRTIPALGLAATGHPVTGQVIAGAEAGYAVTLDEQFSLVPFAGIDIASANTSAFTETGAGPLNLAVAAQATTSTRSILGTRFKGVNVDVAGLALTTELKMGWAHQFTGLAPITRASFAGVAGTNFTVTGAPLPGDAGVVGLGAAVAVADNASMQLRYDGQYSGNAASHTVSFGLAVDW